MSHVGYRVSVCSLYLDKFSIFRKPVDKKDFTQKLSTELCVDKAQETSVGKKKVGCS